MINKAIAFAERKHQGQLDDEGNDYFSSHCYIVGEILKNLTDDSDVICAGYLHDVLEDTKTDYEELVEEFGKRVADLVNEVTHEGKADEKGFYFPRLKSKDGILIKLIDRASNVSKMNTWKEQRKEHYLKKTKFWNDGSEPQFVKQDKEEVKG